MARGRRRFSDLERQLDILTQAGAVPVVGTDVYEYLQFKKGINKITMTSAPTSAERVRLLTAIYPFNLTLGATPTADDLAFVAITAMSNTGRSNVGLASKADLGYETVPSGFSSPTPEFYPAILRVFNKTAAPATTPISGILKKEYKRYAGESYSIPFGRSATLITGTAASIQTASEETSRNVLAGKVKVANARATISYSPEEFGSRRAELAPIG